jgi:uncharacterized glyoxalase superfamily protein PhnB
MTFGPITPLFEVYDMQTSIRFYQDVMGFQVAETSSPGDYTWAMLHKDGARLMLNTAYDEGQRPDEPDRTRGIGHRDAELFIPCNDVDGAYTSLRAAGAHVEAPFTTHFGMRQLWVTDPDGFRLCLNQPAK